MIRTGRSVTLGVLSIALGALCLPGLPGCSGAASSGDPGGSPTETGQPSIPVGEDITTIEVSNLGDSEATTKFTFAVPFAQGDVPAAYGLALVPSLPIQVDKKATHPDGSLRHAIVSGEIHLGPREAKTFAVRAGKAAQGAAPVRREDVLATAYDVTATLSVAGSVYRLSARQLLESGQPKVWLEGPLATEWIVGGAFRDAGNVAHPTLSGYFHVRAYAGATQIRTDVIVENGWFESKDNKDLSYSADVSVQGRSVYSADLSHYAGARWHTLTSWGPKSDVYVKLDGRYLQKIRVAPRYAGTAPKLDGYTQSAAPLTGGDYKTGGYDMGGTGDSDWIGPLPRWDATYFTSTDIRAFRYMIAGNDAAGVFGCNGRYINSPVGVHMRDPRTGLPPSIDDYPSASAADPAVDAIPAFPSANPFKKDTAHEPMIGYSPYLVTGDYYHLEEMMFWNAYNLLEPAPQGRQGSKGLWATNSLRGMAWSYRSLGYAAYITPDAHPFKAYFRDKLMNNLARDQASVDTSGNIFGTFYLAEGNNEYRSFFDDFYTWAIGNLVDLGFAPALPILEYKSRFPLGRMGGTGGNANGYCFQAAPAYTHEMGPDKTSLYASWAEVYAHNNSGCAQACQTKELAACLGADASDPFSIRSGQNATAYYYNEMQPALAISVQYGFGTLADHWRLFTAAKVRPDYAQNPKFGVIPRNAP